MFRSVRRFPPFIKHLRLFSRCCPAEGRCAMGTFVPNLSPVTGKMEWVLRDEDYDYHQEIARSAYADMLHDTERNQKYYQGLRRAVEQFHAAGKAAHVLDIGTGTGLLSMMAAACGADTITACEAFQPMAHCAHQVIERNGLKEKIRLIPKRSTDVTVGKDGDMPHRANILVTEVFDTELIGEGAIGTFHHAHKQLLEKDCLVVPRAANMYVQLVQSEKLRQWNQLQPIKIKGCDDVRPPAAFSKCGGAPSLHDLQLDQLPQTDFQVICQPVKVFRFDYTGKSEIKFKDQSDISVVSERDGRVDAIFMWWEIEMDPKGEIILSCAPNWDHPDPQNMQWRDHWMQAIYYPNKRRVVKEGETIRIQSHHDEYSLWFDVQERSAEMREEDERGICTCGAHITYSRPRIAMLNHNYRNDIYMRVLKQVIGPSSVVLCLGDGSILPVMAGRMGAKKVYTLQPNPLCRRTLQAYCEENSVESEVEILEKLPGEVTAEDIHGDRVDIVIAEPFYLTSILPWHNLQMWYALADLSCRVAPGAKVFPLTATLRFVAVEFADLWKIRAPVGVCEGFDLGIFDKLIESSSDKADAYVEPHPLWEYPSTALCQPITAMDFTLSMDVGQAQSQVVESDVKFECTGCCNGIAMWMEYNFGEDGKVSSGPVSLPIIGKPIQWDRFTRQGVHLFKEPRPISTSDTLQYKVTFYPAAGEFDFFFHINSKTSDTA